MGEWKLFTDKEQYSLRFSTIDNRGHFLCEFPSVIPGTDEPTKGEGYWNDIAKQISFYMYSEIPDTAGFVTYFFNGYQIEGLSTGDPSSDKLWTLVGTCQVSAPGVSLEGLNHLGPEQNSRRQEFGWYAQITEVL